jgi:predicted nuclease of predicted toxin-antitoxin system
MMKLLVDMNLAPAWAPFLRANGFESIHWSSLGTPDAADVAPDVIGGLVLLALRRHARELHDGAIVSIDSFRARVRVLQLTS